MNHLERNCEGIDASVFSSDMLFDDARRVMLKNYIARWSRAIDQHEGAKPTEPSAKRSLAELVLELAEAVDNAAADIGGSRSQLTILREAVAEAQRVKASNGGGHG